MSGGPPPPLDNRLVTGRLIELEALSERDRNAWEELAARALEPNPFAEPDFVLPAAEALDPWRSHTTGVGRAAGEGGSRRRSRR